MEQKKMSKSDPSDQSRINMSDEKDQIINKIKKAKTDSAELPESDENLNKRPELINLYGIFSSLQNQSLNSTVNEFRGKNFLTNPILQVFSVIILYLNCAVLFLEFIKMS